jgi:hypothetical protein
MKIAVNKCYGGFSLSPLATKRYGELKGIQVYFYKQTKYRFKDGCDEYVKTDNLNDNNFSIYAYTKDYGTKIKILENECYFSNRPEDRSDPDLIKVIEELGNQANGRCANIKIIDIPDDVEWEIEEYDGSEWISEKHRTW